MFRLCVCIHFVAMKYLAIRKNEILPFGTTWIDLKGIMLHEINLIEEDKCCIVSFMCKM